MTIDLKDKEGRLNVYRLVVALLVLSTLAYKLIHTFILANTPVEDGGIDIIFAPLFFIRAFTHTGNLIIGVGLLLIVFGKIDKKNYIYLVSFGTLIFIVYGLLLSDGFIVESWHGKILHYFAPILILIDYIFFLDVTDYKYKHIPKYLIIPLIYLVYAIIQGYVYGEFVYFFFDIEEVGIGGFFAYFFGMLFGYLLVALFFSYIKNKFDKTA